MSNRLQLSLACGDYDRTKALLNGDGAPGRWGVPETSSNMK